MKKVSPGQLNLFALIPVVGQEKPIAKEKKSTNIGNSDASLNCNPYEYYKEFTEEQKEIKNACPLRDECGCCCSQSCYEWALRTKNEQKPVKEEINEFNKKPDKPGRKSLNCPYCGRYLNDKECACIDLFKNAQDKPLYEQLRAICSFNGYWTTNKCPHPVNHCIDCVNAPKLPDIPTIKKLAVFNPNKENSFYLCPRCKRNKGKALVPNFNKKIFNSGLVCRECSDEMDKISEEAGCA